MLTASCPVIEVNPSWLDPGSYVDLLNEGFPRQWSRRAYDWYMARAFETARSDLLVRCCGGRMLAGMAVGYRRIAVGSEASVKVGVLGAAVTRSGARGQGHYGALLQAAIARSRARGCGAVLGFVTRDNASGRGLWKLGAVGKASFYIMSDGQESGHRQSRRDPPAKFSGACGIAGVTALGLEHARLRHEERFRTSASVARFAYEQKADWHHQFLLRPHPVRQVRTTCGGMALLESVHDTDRLQWLGCARERFIANVAYLAQASASAGRRFFMYTMDPRHAACAPRIGLRVKPGYLMLMRTGGNDEAYQKLITAHWSVQSGDRL